MSFIKKNTWIFVVPILIALDQFTKFIVEASLELGETVVVIENLFHWTHLRNDGAAWGLFSGQMLFFYIMSAFALVVFGYFAASIDFKKAPIYSVAIVLLISGTLGNLIDRVQFGFVIDFIDVYIFGYNYPVFNVADIFLTVGTLMLGFDLLFLEKRRTHA
jgi:signal peptidase II